MVRDDAGWRVHKRTGISSEASVEGQHAMVMEPGLELFAMDLSLLAEQCDRDWKRNLQRTADDRELRDKSSTWEPAEEIQEHRSSVNIAHGQRVKRQDRENVEHTGSSSLSRRLAHAPKQNNKRDRLERRRCVLQ